MLNTPNELTAAIDVALESTAAQQYAAGNDKALNAVVGMVLRQYKANPAVIRELISARFGRTAGNKPQSETKSG